MNTEPIDPVALLERFADELRTHQEPESTERAEAIDAALHRLSLAAEERDKARAELAVVPSVDIQPNVAGHLVATIRGRGGDVIAGQNRANSGATALRALQLLAGLGT